jgi:hypothetical protein
VVHCEAHVLPLFRGVAVFTQVVCPLTNVTPNAFRYPLASGQLLILLAPGMKKIAGDTVEKAQVIIDLLIEIQFLFVFGA